MAYEIQQRPLSPTDRQGSVRPRITTPAPALAAKVDRARRLMQVDIDYIHSAEFERDGADAIIAVSGQAEVAFRAGRRKAPSDVHAQHAHLWEVALLSREEERQLFRRMNFQKYRADMLRRRLNSQRPSVRLMDRIEACLTDARLIRSHIIQANMRLVVSIARKFVSDAATLDELISDGNLVLVKAVDRFDYSRGFRFSTYATHALQRDFYRNHRIRQRRRNTELSANPDALFHSVEGRESESGLLRDSEVVDYLKNLMSDCLDSRENKIVDLRFGLRRDDGGQTLREVGEKLNISKERVRQLQSRAMEKIRQIASSAVFDM